MSQTAYFFMSRLVWQTHIEHKARGNYDHKLIADCSLYDFCAWLCAHECVHVCVYAHMHTNTHTFTHTHTHTCTYKHTLKHTQAHRTQKHTKVYTQTHTNTTCTFDLNQRFRLRKGPLLVQASCLRCKAAIGPAVPTQSAWSELMWWIVL